jgi:hypothetical protein
MRLDPDDFVLAATRTNLLIKDIGHPQGPMPLALYLYPSCLYSCRLQAKTGDGSERTSPRT